MFCTHRFNFVGIAAFILILLNQSAFAADAEVDGGNIVITPCKGKPDGYKYIVRGVEKVCNKGLVVVDLNNSGNVYEDNNGSATSTTGSGSGTGSNSGSGNGSGTGNSSGSDNGSDTGTNQPNTPVPNTPTPPYNLPPEKLKKLNEELASLARMYQQELKKLEGQKLSAKSSYESSVVACHGQYQSYGAAAIKNCVDSAKKKFDEEIAELDKKMAEKVDMFNQAVKDLYAAYGVDIGKTPNVTAPNATGSTDVITDSNGNKFCKINGTWQPCGSNAGTNAGNANTNGGAGTTNNTTTNNTTNNSTSNNSSNTTVNNNTTVVNNDGSSGSSGNGSGSNNNASGQSGSGNATGSQGDGKGDKGHCDAYPDTLGCSKLGSQADIDKQINSSAGKDGRFGIGESNVSINSFTKANIFLETGSCPSPKSFVVFKTRHEISYQSLCDAVQQFRPFVIVSAVLVSFLIVRQAIVSQL
ncbi:virulence factor TspB C-terminal domain-related protein [Kingella kingae]|uniref:virulence factor TspB C-terminal domain-related protein n=6 Tax=Kingella kingae TaxID=504 RepID=UPI0002585FD1|nr:virulence factor TspB C-terminal domain-related protein [Kingella kingae]EIC13911.1 hypothetical protein KKB_04587 [Kingella kingae PYKK081]MBD3613179.1 hypothetical protein [Kingella kingae]MBD3631537.1 hypothetical protein [Kingella kingae]MBD3658845.1 hypothetical protein [Kingella kingae]MDK4618907.1 virulence factor TspB C-terminal domain-related protein [Kingella kingae]